MKIEFETKIENIPNDEEVKNMVKNISSVKPPVEDFDEKKFETSSHKLSEYAVGYFYAIASGLLIKKMFEIVADATVVEDGDDEQQEKENDMKASEDKLAYAALLSTSNMKMFLDRASIITYRIVLDIADNEKKYSKYKLSTDKVFNIDPEDAKNIAEAYLEENGGVNKMVESILNDIKTNGKYLSLDEFQRQQNEADSELRSKDFSKGLDNLPEKNVKQMIFYTVCSLISLFLSYAIPLLTLVSLLLFAMRKVENIVLLNMLLIIAAVEPLLCYLSAQGFPSKWGRSTAVKVRGNLAKWIAAQLLLIFVDILIIFLLVFEVRKVF